MPPHIDSMQSGMSSMGTGVPDGFSGGADGTSHQVIANFFQSLLLRKASTGGGGGTGGGSSPTATSPGGSLPVTGAEEGTTGRRGTISRKEVHKELDRMRQYVNKP